MLKDFVVETCNAPGTATTVTLLGALTGRLTWKGSGFTNGATAFYYMEDGSISEWGIGTLNHGTPDTFSRTTVLGNSSGTTSRLNFTGVTRIYNEIPSARALWKDSTGGLDLESRTISAMWWAGNSTGTGSAYVVTLPKAVGAYTGGLEFKWRAAATCTAGATLNAGQGAKTINRPTSFGLQPIQAGEIVAGQVVQTIYDPTTDTFVLSHPPPGGLSVPIGTWLAGGWSTLPPGCLWPDGRNVSRTTYAALFAAYSTTFGAGDGSTTFGLPDLRGRAIFGRDDMGGTAASRITSAVCGVVGTNLAAAGGDERIPTHSHTGSSGAAGTHQHSLNINGSTLIFGTSLDASGGGAGSVISWVQHGGVFSGYCYSDNIGSHSHTITINNAGNGASGNLPPAKIGNIVIYAGVS